MMIDNQPDRPALTSALKAEIARKAHPSRTIRVSGIKLVQGTSRLHPDFWLRKGKPMSEATARKKLKALVVVMSGQSYPMATLMAEARLRGLSGALVMSRLRSGWTIEAALFEFAPEAARKPKAKRSTTPKPNPELDAYFIKPEYRSGVNQTSRQFTGRRQLAKLVPEIADQLESCKPSEPCMNSSCRKCWGLSLDEERSWTTHPKNQAGAAVADALAGYDGSELHFLTIMHSHEGFQFDPHARTAEFQAKLGSALNGSNVTASGFAEIQPALHSGVPGFSYHYHGVIGSQMSRQELRKLLHQEWPETGQVVIKDIDPEKGGCLGIGSYACKERVIIPSELADVESASEIALQMMNIWEDWKIEDRHVHVGCPQMTMAVVHPKDRENDSAHRSAHDVDPPCGGWFMDTTDADQYWSRYEELGEVDYECPLSASDEVFEELGDGSDDMVFRPFFNKSIGILVRTSEVVDSIGPRPENRPQNILPNQPIWVSGEAFSYPDIGSTSVPTVPNDQARIQDHRNHRRNVPL